MSLVEEIQQSWGWMGIKPMEIVGENDFGNLMVKDEEGKYWRLRPEDLSCKVVAKNRKELDALSVDQEFLHDWYMRELVNQAQQQLGPLSEGRKYCLKIPSVLGGEHGGENLAIISLVELVRVSGDIARQLQGIPDRSLVRLRIVD
jgi:hypothetical protein